MTIEAIIPLVIMGGAFLLIAIVAHTTGRGNLDHIKSKTVGDGQHGTARWATKKEIQQTFKHNPFRPETWRKRLDLPTDQGLVLGCVGGGSAFSSLWAKIFKRRKKGPERPTIQALVDTDDIHCLMIGASGIGKTAFFLYPNLEYACACVMSFLALDTKGDLARNYGTIASRCYGYQVAVIDLRNPTRSDGYNLLTLINHYMDICREDSENLAARAKAEKYANILSKTIVNPDGDASLYGQNAFFYDVAEGLLTAVVLLLAEYLPTDKKTGTEQRHIVSVFKLVQDLLAPSRSAKGKNGFQVLMNKLPDTHKARWFAGAALNSADQAMMSVMSTVLSRLNAFLGSELEQVLCFDSAINAESFASRKSAIFLILPEEDSSKNFMAGLMIQPLSRELFTVADENGGKLKNRVVLFCDELGTMPAFDILPLFSAGRSRKLTLVPIIQSLAQLEKNYGKEGAEIIQDNVQDTIFGGFAPNSQTAEVLSKALGNRTVMSGSVSRGKNDPSQSLQIIERPLMTPDELKSIPKGQFIVMKTGTHPMRTRLRLFLECGITFEEPYVLPEKAARKVAYASKKELEAAIDAHVRDQAAVQAEAAGTAPAPAADDPQNDKNDAEQPKPVDLRTDTEKERDHGVF
ncbi:type IV secretory system conjugative DNA transfer family protein [Colidextribacter sp. 210702-DFI.3.9]|nr:type IV secretory system conjugative DNA transfer family protein [Colidextribacter sp. 210702-DFI.3.9]MCG4470093.1 type IV secretory system conjugative DNA transfer family protein [Lawsonibacter sp. DFI.6.74]MCG4774507.1 type IV secretory system conjugative DNA transfer family protein [Lawsonibacter sp. DFI.5.51]